MTEITLPDREDVQIAAAAPSYTYNFCYEQPDHCEVSTSGDADYDWHYRGARLHTGGNDGDEIQLRVSDQRLTEQGVSNWVFYNYAGGAFDVSEFRIGIMRSTNDGTYRSHVLDFHEPRFAVYTGGLARKYELDESDLGSSSHPRLFQMVGRPDESEVTFRLFDYTGLIAEWTARDTGGGSARWSTIAWGICGDDNDSDETVAIHSYSHIPFADPLIER